MEILGVLVLAGAVAYGATVVKDDRTPLRASCYSDGALVTTLPQGSPVTIRYALSGESVPCYKVVVDIAGKTVEGYLAADKLKNLEEFDSVRREARVLDLGQAMGETHTSADPLPKLNVGTSNKTAAQAAA